MRVLFQDDHAIISNGESSLEFASLKTKKINNLYKISQLQFELYTRIPHVDCPAHMLLGEDILATCVLAEDIRTIPTSNIH